MVNVSVRWDDVAVDDAAVNGTQGWKYNSFHIFVFMSQIAICRSLLCSSNTIPLDFSRFLVDLVDTDRTVLVSWKNILYINVNHWEPIIPFIKIDLNLIFIQFTLLHYYEHILLHHMGNMKPALYRIRYDERKIHYRNDKSPFSRVRNTRTSY